ncbi:MAG: hypothetical protein DI626_06835 [Micavibrio aeruginosavorus]|uniref:Uncharacterized protein n=1 Tax=Micavibrio aeruginosavorus TaxID=349221 RepID=A0A2W4ZUM3_9BACT|nr:MAG: hypothetical protein DI626_06835 [Micavibrio aeruginosavorus]
MSIHEVALDFDNPVDIEAAKRKLSPIYRVAAERVDEWKEREVHALEKRNATQNPLSWLFWQIRYLSAVGNGAESERCRDGLYDPHWGCLTAKDDAKAKAESYQTIIRDHNRRTHGL